MKGALLKLLDSMKEALLKLSAQHEKGILL
jgi:hypothetical protein